LLIQAYDKLKFLFLLCVGSIILIMRTSKPVAAVAEWQLPAIAPPASSFGVAKAADNCYVLFVTGLSAFGIWNSGYWRAFGLAPVWVGGKVCHARFQGLAGDPLCGAARLT
jgi:hypothetical protein